MAFGQKHKLPNRRLKIYAETAQVFDAMKKRLAKLRLKNAA